MSQFKDQATFEKASRKFKGRNRFGVVCVKSWIVGQADLGCSRNSR